MGIKSYIRKRINQKHIYTLLHLKKSIPLIGGSFQKSYSGNGEDIILSEYLFRGVNEGFYVDVGSFHPKIISNTYKLYKKGWHGINIDPNPQAVKLFNKYRKRDKNLQLGISKEKTKLKYYNFSYSGANTFDEEFAKEKMNKEWNTLISVEEIQCLPLTEVFSSQLKDGQKINFIDVDVEGHDLEVLKSNDWDKYRPEVVLVEDKEFRNVLNDSKIYCFLESVGYKFHSYMDITLVMTEKQFSPNAIAKTKA